VEKEWPKVMNVDELTCQQVVELVTEYLEHTLLPQLQKQFEEHLAECPGCTTYLEQIWKMTMLLRTLAQEPVFPGTKQELLELFQKWKQGEEG
jgi:predicted anti-sigma-YlaC factor YlaD